MSIAVFAIGDAPLCALPSQKVKSATMTPVRRQYVVRSDAVALPKAR
jgi:hypothetical protein